MGLRDIAGKVGKAAVNGTLWYLETASDSVSKNRTYTDEQREGMREFSDRMHNARRSFNGYDEDCDSDYDDDY